MWRVENQIYSDKMEHMDKFHSGIGEKNTPESGS